MVTIEYVQSGSIAEELGLCAGDRLLSINGETVRDLIDFQLFEAQENLLLDVEKADGELWELEFSKDPDEPLGLDVEHPEPFQCGNNCLFCFVHQLPRGMRRTLYVKDEDYRFSFLYGAYITLSNIREDDLERIVRQRLSPLYISVHATRPEVRGRLLGRPVPPVLGLMQRLVEAGIELHTQVVICPGINDGDVLAETVRDLYALHPGVRSLALVPVGLTGYRARLPELRPVTPDEAIALLDQLSRWQETFLARGGSRFVFAADELYLTAERPFPPLDAYEDLAQIENGVGLVPQFRDEAAAVLAEASPVPLERVTLVTGESFAGELGDFAGRLARASGVELVICPVVNRFFGGHVSVAGLVTGEDILGQLKELALGAGVLLPDVMFREGEELLLDDVSRLDLERALGVPVLKVASTPWGIWDGLEQLAETRGTPGQGATRKP